MEVLFPYSSFPCSSSDASPPPPPPLLSVQWALVVHSPLIVVPRVNVKATDEQDTGGWHVGEALSVPGHWLRRSHSTEDQNGCLESVFPPHLCCCHRCDQLPISSYQQEASDQTKDFISFWLDLAGPCITRKSSEGSGIIWTWGVGTCAGHGAGKSWTPLPGGSRALQRWDRRSRPGCPNNGSAGLFVSL